MKSLDSSLKKKANLAFDKISLCLDYNFKKEDPLGYNALKEIIEKDEVNEDVYLMALHLLNFNQGLWIKLDDGDYFDGNLTQFQDTFGVVTNSLDVEDQADAVIDFIETSSLFDHSRTQIFWEGKKVYDSFD